MLTSNEERELLKVTDIIFKKLANGAAATVIGASRKYFEEPLRGRKAVFPTQVWRDHSLVPAVAPAPGAIVGVDFVQVLAPSAGVHGGVYEYTDPVTGLPVLRYYSELVLDAVPGCTHEEGPGTCATSFRLAVPTVDLSLRDGVPMEFGEDEGGGGYGAMFSLRGYSTNPADEYVFSLGENDYWYDAEAGVVTFYDPVGTKGEGGGDGLVGKLYNGTTRDPMKLRVSFVRYVGRFGIDSESDAIVTTVDNLVGMQPTTSLAARSQFVFVTVQSGSGPTVTELTLPLTPSENTWYWIKDTGGASEANVIHVTDPSYPGGIVESSNPNLLVMDEPYQWVMLYYHDGAWYVMTEGRVESGGVRRVLLSTDRLVVSDREQYNVSHELINSGPVTVHGELNVSSVSEYDGTWWHIRRNQHAVVGERKNAVVYNQLLLEGTLVVDGTVVVIDDSLPPYKEQQFLNSTSVTVVHGFGRYAAVTVLNTSGVKIAPLTESHSVSRNQVTVTFASPTSGTVACY